MCCVRLHNAAGSSQIKHAKFTRCIMEKSTTKFLWRYSKMEENNVVMENEELETETVPAEETYDESNGGSTLIGVAIGVRELLEPSGFTRRPSSRLVARSRMASRLTRLRSWPRRRARRTMARTLLRSNPSTL